MPRLDACLLDAYDTTVYTDYTPYRDELPALAGIPAPVMWAEFRQLGPALSVGQITMPEAFSRILRAGGVEPEPALVRELTDKSRELLLAAGRRYDDVLPFLRTARSRGIRTAIVSNCDENTVDLLATLGVTALADAQALSFQVGAVKPAQKIYFEALGRLGVPAGAALFVDNSAAYCAGAAELGLRAVQMVRGAAGDTPAGFPVVRSLAEVEALIAADAAG